MSEAKSINELNADLFQPEEDERYCDPKKIRKKAMDFLARREYGRMELVDKLASAGYDATLVEIEVERLADEGLQSDERFAGSFLQSRINQGKGPVRVRQDLKERGMASALIDDVLLAADCDWFELARSVRVRKFGESLPVDFSEKARQMRFLQYRGFESEQIQAAVQSRGDD